MKIHVTATIAFTIALASLVGCKSKLDDAKLEEAIKTGLKNANLEIKSLACPKDIDQKQGNDFECKGEGTDGTKFLIKVTQPDDSGNIKWKLEVPGADKPAADKPKSDAHEAH